MSWLSDSAPRDVARVEIARVTLSGKPSSVVAAVLRVHLVDGGVTTVEVGFETGEVMYETLRDDVAAFNRWRARR